MCSVCNFRNRTLHSGFDGRFICANFQHEPSRSRLQIDAYLLSDNPAGSGMTATLRFKQLMQLAAS